MEGESRQNVCACWKPSETEIKTKTANFMVDVCHYDEEEIRQIECIMLCGGKEV